MKTPFLLFLTRFFVLEPSKLALIMHKLDLSKVKPYEVADKEVKQIKKSEHTIIFKVFKTLDDPEFRLVYFTSIFSHQNLSFLISMI